MAWEEREEELESQLNRGALWAITYGDLMSYLCIFFLLLYTAVTSKSMALQMALQGVSEQFGKEGKLMQELFSKHGVQKIAKLEVLEDKIRIVFLAPILFDSGSATMKDAAKPDVKRLAESFLEIPNPIAVEGHTDDVPLSKGAGFASNWELSAARAFAILRFLEQSGVPSRRLSAIGYGEYRPVKPNDSPDNRTANRRIEINLMRKEQ